MDATSEPLAATTLAEGLTGIARKGLDLSHVLTTVTTHHAIDATKALAHCHHIALDGSCLPRLQDFTNEIAEWVLDYVIPRTKLMTAQSSDNTERRLKEARLRREAIDTFKTSGISGEQGEMLLFVLSESLLHLPQLLCKMDLKTDHDMHFFGVDGVHCGADSADPDRLAVYWCESKVHKTLDGALTEAFDGLKPFLLGPGSGEKDKRRELALLDRYMDLGDDDIQERVLQALNPNSPAFNAISWRGLCLVGFDYAYPSKPNEKKHADFLKEVSDKFPDWAKMVTARAKNRNLETFEIHVFYVPFGFCEDFRKCMAVSLGIA
jgi:hypothetical protein